VAGRRTRRQLCAAHTFHKSLASLLFLASTPGLLFASGEAVPLGAFDLPPGASVTLVFEVTVDNPLGACATAISNQGTVTGTGFSNILTDDPSVGGTSDPTATPLDAVDLAITKTDGVGSEIPGTPITYTIVASNSGPSAATGATVADTFPGTLTGATWSCVGSGPFPGTCTAAGIGSISDSVNLPVGGAVTYTVNATIAADATGSLVNTATVTKSANQIECNLTNNSATDTDTLTPNVDLAITKTDGLTDVDAGGPITYTIGVTNAGPSDAVGATVADTFPATLLSPTWTCTASLGSSCPSPGSGSINHSVTVLAGGTLTYTVNATVSGTASGTLTNTATVTAALGTLDTDTGNNSAIDTTTINPVADLSITKSDGTTTAVPGMTTTYTLIAANAGPATATGASVTDTFPAACTTVSWTCIGANGGTCTAGPVTGNISDSVNLPAAGTATYTAVCTISDSATGTLVNIATIAGGGVSDTTPGNNTATDTDTLLTLDFGDAPDSSLAPPSGYPTLLADNGARHGNTGLRMGALIDSESDGQPTVNADGDDQVSGPNVDDEDGVTLPALLVACESASVTVAASAPGRLDAWVDFNSNGSFADPGEKIFDNQLLAAGPNPLAFSAACTAVPAPKTFARFRLSTVGGLAANAVAADGEVEDYTIAIAGVDFGDAADPAYPTLVASNGARHAIVSGGPFLGVAVDVESNGQPNAGATGDDLASADDEDGVTFTSPIIPGQSATVTVVAAAAGVLNAWLDFDADGNFSTAGDAIFVNQALVLGPNNLTFAVPATANSNTATVSRFRVASTGGLSFNGFAADGEVEDHALTTTAIADLAITKTDGSATEVPGTPVTYTIVATNAGPDPVAGASVSDAFPGILSGCSWTSVAAGGATGNTPGPVAGDIVQPALAFPAGSSITYAATCNIAPAATGTLVNTATITAPGAVFDSNGANNSAIDSDALIPSTDVSVTKTDGSATEIPGTPVTYTLVATNSGPSTATGVSVTDGFPAALSGCSWTSVAAGGATGNTSGPVSGNIAETGITMPPAASVTYTATCNIDPAARGTLVNTATVASATNDPTPGNNSATDTDTLTPQVDLGVVKVESIDPVVAGSGVGNLTYTITVTNVGPSTATLVTLSESLTLPAGVTLVSVTPSQGTFTDPTWTLGTLSPAASATLTVVLTASAAAATGSGVICDTAAVTSAAETLINTGNDSDTECTSVLRQVDMVVSKTESIDPVVAGSGAGNLTYVVTVTNNGPSNASGITLSEVVTTPAGVTVDSATPSQGTFASPNWTVGSLASGASATLTVVLTATSAALPGTDVICDTATLTAVNEAQVLTGNESDNECTSVTVSADLSITKIDDADPPPAGSDLTYTLTVTNNGPSNAVSVVVTDPLPAAVTYVSDTCGASNVPPWTWNIGTLNNGATISCDITVSINPTPPGSISNTATVTSSTNDAVPGNNSDTEDTTLDAVPPQVVNVDSIAGSGDATLEECETTGATIDALLVTFDEGMHDPAGSSDPDDVTNPANYLVVTPGADFDFQTTACGGAAGDDVAVPVTGVTYASGTDTASLTLGASIPAGQARLFACDTLTDLAGNALDGDADSNAGGDFRRAFRTDPGNVFENGHFDCDADSWNVIAATPAEVTWTGAEDADEADDSGSVHFTNLAPGSDTSFKLWQCYDIPAAALFDVSVRVRLDAGAGVFIGFSRRCEFFNSSGCFGSLGAQTAAFALQNTGGNWIPISGQLNRPVGATAARCDFAFETATAASFDGYLDTARFSATGSIFSDGFESGDTSAWSATVP
jgi:uncharacterized repeat protein (TIGR01451 family)